ncbi:hypothetical protein COU59_02085 [Candidatus Pacearchaeota archaeon CG10_big_fil_rev_8_21_14_0_10_34_12]|nr:MAG: hypothetical protein COU59_02085 [Candidatus Pacearchaeota archaeon CG10_big_fil_rev_8_21_14_0_10_34_12]
MANFTELRRCPFYGFSVFDDTFLDFGKHNLCAFDGRYAPCYMESNNMVPDWRICAHNNPKEERISEERAKKTIVFPREFCPEDKHKWRGIPLVNWRAYIESLCATKN